MRLTHDKGPGKIHSLVGNSSKYPLSTMPHSAADFLDNLNSTFDKKLLATGALFVAWYFVCLYAPSIVEPMAILASTLLPSVEKLRQAQPPAPTPFAYFGSSALILPLSTGYLIWGMKFRERFRAGQERSGRSKLEFVLMQYLLGLPFVLLVIYLAAFAPIEISEDTRSFGGKLFLWMLNSKSGLLLMGPFILVMMELAFMMLLSYLIMPFSFLIALINNQSKRHV